MGCNMTTSKKHISQFGKTFDYLKNAELRDKEKGDALITVDGATVAGNGFQYVEWRNMVFKNCDFVGAYEVKLSRMTNVRFEDCRFAGIFGFGVATNAHFLRCGWAGPSIGTSRKGSKNVVFEECKFVGETSDPNHRGGVGSDGEAKFIRCTAKWFTLEGYEKLELLNCELNTCNIDTDSVGNSGENFSYSSVLIDNCKLRGLFKMVSSSLQSLTIRDTVIDNLDLSGATVKGDIFMERIKAATVNAGVTNARNFTITDSQINGPGDITFVMAMDSVEQVLLDGVSFGTGLTTRVNLGPGRALRADEWLAVPTNKLAVIRNCTLPIVDASWLETQHLKMEKNTIGSINLSSSRIGTLELTGNTISRTVDFTHTQARQSKVQALAKGPAKLDGSNVKVN